jgi:xanthine/CO dehydrogenase XdhC/CoxF family maturation factor
LIGSACAYIGLLGPKQKLEKMLNELHAKGLKSDPDLLCKLHGPVGLDIGAETAEEIALSIMAEIKAVFSDRRGTPLKNRPVEIHERPHSVQHG